MFGKNANIRQSRHGVNAGLSAINAVTEICGIVLSEVSIEESLKHIAKITADSMGVEACSVMLYDKTTMELSIKAALGIGAEAAGNININNKNSVPAMAIREKKTQRSEKPVHRPILPGSREFADIKSMISAPIMINGEPIGVINSYSCENHEFTDNEKMAIEAIAAQSAVAIQHAKLREEAEEAKTALKHRKIIEKAKGILMKKRQIAEDAAYRIIRQKSMDTGKPMVEVAEAVVLTDEIGMES